MRRPGIWVANGSPADPQKMLSWRPGALTSFFDYLGPNRVFQYKQTQPQALVIVRFQHPKNWHADPVASARDLGDMVLSKWPELRDIDPYIYFCNEVNLHYENGDNNVGNQPKYETREFYQRYANWVRMTADHIKQRTPQMKLVCPPFAFGHHEDGAPDDNGNPKDGWAGYDYLTDTIKSHFDNIITFHAYWGNAGGSIKKQLYDAEESSWYAFRWRRVLKLFEKRYANQVRVIIDEAGNFGASDPDFTDQIIYYTRQTLADARVIALTFFLWQDPTGSPGNIPNSWVDRCRNLDAHVAQLAALPDIATQPLPSQPTTPPVPSPKTIRLLMPDGSVRVLAVEEYLRGVVAAEMSPSWPLEALKAQAVAARSYAMISVQYPRHRPDADICTTTHCQAYNESRINPNSDQAVQATSSQVILYQNQLAIAYYSANCGGTTVGNETIWGGSPLPYLRPVKCINPGPKNGHAVGMCQWGAHDMAKRGDSYVTILKHYYTGITLSAGAGQPVQPVQPPATTAGEIRGKVTDQEGHPVRDVRLQLSRAGWNGETTTGADGTYRFANLPAGTYSLVVIGYNVRRDGLVLAEGQGLVADLTIQGPQTVWRMQVDRRAGQLPILGGSLPRVGIEVTLKTPLGGMSTRTSGSKPQYGLGGFEFWAPSRGTHQLSFLDQSFKLTMEGQFTIVTFTEEAASTNPGTVAGTLRNQAGAPVAGRQVALTGAGRSLTTITASDGSFRFDNLPAGDYTVTVPGTDLTRAVHCDGTTPVNLVLAMPSAAPAGQWLMKVTRTAGPPYIAGVLPEAGITVTITLPGGQRMQATSGSKPDLGVGGFQVPAVVQGTYTIQFFDQTFQLRVDGQFTRIDFVRSTTSADAQARLVTRTMPMLQADELLRSLESDAKTCGLFKMDGV
jgi:Stage II sporulation protein/Carboxypeptidase regulatory-like domain